jgi:hypothetical protein
MDGGEIVPMITPGYVWAAIGTIGGLSIILIGVGVWFVAKE